MPRPTHIQPPHPQQQLSPVRYGQRYGVPAAVVERFGGVLAQFEEEPAGPVGHFADYGVAGAGGLEVVQGGDAVGAEDAFVPGSCWIFIGERLVRALFFDLITVGADLPG